MSVSIEGVPSTAGTCVAGNIVGANLSTATIVVSTFIGVYTYIRKRSNNNFFFKLDIIIIFPVQIILTNTCFTIKGQLMASNARAFKAADGVGTNMVTATIFSRTLINI